MSEKRKTLTSENFESDRQFLEHHNVNGEIRELITKLLENRPVDPISFITDYFGEKANKIQKAYQQVLLTHYSQPAFHKNLHNAYKILSENKAGKVTGGLSGQIHREIILLVIKDIPQVAQEKIIKKIVCRDYEFVVFEIFYTSIYTCLLFHDFLKQADLLFQELDINKTNKLNVNTAQALLSCLDESISETTDFRTPTQALKAGFNLGPAQIEEALKQVSSKSNKNLDMSNEDFLNEIADIFIKKVS